MTRITWNPLDKDGTWLLSNNNLTAKRSPTFDSWTGVRATEGKSSGKWYWEYHIDLIGLYMNIGIASSNTSLNFIAPILNIKTYDQRGHKNTPHSANYGVSYTTGDTIGIKLDMDIGTIEFLKNNVSQGVAFSDLLSLGTVFPFLMDNATGVPQATANFGATFKYPIPNDYKPYDTVNKILIQLSDGEYKYYKKHNKVANFSFDEASGNALDSVNPSVVGTVTGATRVEGWDGEGKALSFNGTSNFVQFDKPVIPIGRKSVRLRVKMPSKPTSNQVIFGNTSGATKHGFRVGVLAETGGIYVYITKGIGEANLTSFNSLENICDNQWHDVLFTWDGTTSIESARLYVDDMSTPKVKGTPISAETSSYSDYLVIGSRVISNDMHFNGQIDNLEIYSEVYNPPLEDTWQTLSTTTPTEQDYINHGMENSVLSSIPEGAWQELEGTVEIHYYTDNPSIEEVQFNIETTPFTLAEEFEGKQLEILEYTDNPSQIESVVETETEPYTIYDEFGDTMEVLYYTDDPDKNEAELEITANYSPLDEIEGDFEVVTWTDTLEEVSEALIPSLDSDIEDGSVYATEVDLTDVIRVE